jgi:uracil-DNA glycosylase family 4
VTLELDPRQRAMLLEMGVRVFLPQTEPEPLQVSTRLQIKAAITPQAQSIAQPVQMAEASVPAPAASAVLPLQGSAQELAQAAASCQACGLCAGRKKTTLRAEAIRPCAWMLLCDPPDEDEDREGMPLVQSAGQLLDNMLRAVGKDRHSAGSGGVYVSNVVKCRPPHGHIPQPSELAQCAAFLQREIALVQPQVILAMGHFARQLLLSEQPEQAALPLGKQRGNLYRYHGISVVVSYSISDLLRRSGDKAKAWADLCLAIQKTSQQSQL